MSQRLMRLANLVMIIVVFLLIGCGPTPVGGNTTATASPTRTASPTATAMPTPMPSPTPTPRPSPTAKATPKPTSAPPAPRPTGRVILISLSRQWLYTYEDGAFVFSNAVETGMPQLPTPTGSFSILSKARDVTFFSPWPEASPYYYNPTHINCAMEFKSGGFYLHDAWWHVVFGPGGNVPHRLSNGKWETGSHGCVGMTIPNARRLYAWCSVGTPVIIVH